MTAIRYEVIGNARRWSMKYCRSALTLGIVGVGAALFPLRAVDAQSTELPEGPGRAVLLENCTACHGAEQITAQRRSSDEWEQVVNRMIGNGASLTDDQYKEVVAYLGTYLGKAAASGAAPASAARSGTEPVGQSKISPGAKPK